MNGGFREKEQNHTVCTHSCRYSKEGTACASSTPCQLQKSAGLNCPSSLGSPWAVISRSAGTTNLHEFWPVSTPVLQVSCLWAPMHLFTVSVSQGQESCNEARPFPDPKTMNEFQQKWAHWQDKLLTSAISQSIFLKLHRKEKLI